MGTVALILSLSSGWTQSLPSLPPLPPPCDPSWGENWLIANGCPGTYTVFDQTFVRDTGKPKTENAGFTVPVTGEGNLKIVNGPNSGKRISSAVIDLNGETIIEPDKFNQNVGMIEMPVQFLKGSNTLSVKLNSNPGGSISMQIIIEIPEPVAAAGCSNAIPVCATAGIVESTVAKAITKTAKT